MKLNPYKLIHFFIDKKDGMLKVRVPDIIKDEVSIEIDSYELNIKIK